MNDILSAEKVEAIFKTCLSDTADGVIAEGIIGKYSFDEKRIVEASPAIKAMVAQLPNAFQERGGGGMSFLNAGVDKNGDLWTGLHQTMEHLFVLGMAIDAVKCLLPRSQWAVLPGAMPYYCVLDQEGQNE